MGFFDKMKETAAQARDAVKAHKEESSEAKKPLDGCIQWYEVVYKGGLPQYGMDKTSSIKGSLGMNIMENSFYFKPLITAKSWFADLEIPYDRITKFELIKRSVGNAEVLLSASSTDAAALATLNTMAITYLDSNDEEIYLKMEMLTGISVQGQAKKCQEMLDVLRMHKILARINYQQ